MNAMNDKSAGVRLIDTYIRDELNVQMLLASNRMSTLEQFDGKSADYARGFLDGILHQTEFLMAILPSFIKGSDKSIDKLQQR